MNKNILIIFTLFLSVTLEASCSSYYLLGSKNQSIKSIKTKNSILWEEQDNKWSVSPPKDNLNLSDIECKNSGYVLINNDEITYDSSNYKKKYYELKEGWNYIYSSMDGVDVVKTFSNVQTVEFVYVYDKASQAWAGYSPNKDLMKKILSTRILYLKYVEPGLGFYLYSKKSIKVDIVGSYMNKICQDKLSGGLSFLLDSAVIDTKSFDKDADMGITSRYLSHQRRGVYNDTRVALIYKKADKLIQGKKLLKYGTAKPKVKFKFNKGYEENRFYVYDYYEKECYEGIFPSMKIPPFATLKKLK